MDLAMLSRVWVFLSTTGKSILSENLVIVFVVLWTVRSHFRKLEDGLANVAKQVNKLSEALLGVETRHTERLNNIEKRVGKLETIKGDK